MADVIWVHYCRLVAKKNFVVELVSGYAMSNQFVQLKVCNLPANMRHFDVCASRARVGLVAVALINAIKRVFLLLQSLSSFIRKTNLLLSIQQMGVRNKKASIVLP